MSRLPAAATVPEFDAVRRDEALLRPGAERIARRHGRDEPVERFAAGSLPVYAVGEAHVLKMYPPCYEQDFVVESAALELLHGRLPVPTPRVDAVGKLDGWRYVLMERLRGRILAEAWPDIPARDRQALSEQLGACIAALRDLATGGTPIPRLDLDRQLEGAIERQRSLGLPETWLAQVPGFLAAHPLGRATPEVFLHTELMREHLFAAETPSGWRLTGLIDFESARVGAPEAELASVGLFVTCAEPGLLGPLLRAAGLTPDEALQRRCLTAALLHPFANLPWYMRRLPPPADVTTLERLAGHWWVL